MGGREARALAADRIGGAQHDAMAAGPTVDTNSASDQQRPTRHGEEGIELRRIIGRLADILGPKDWVATAV